MAKIEWNDNLSIGVDVVDEQHQMWIQKFNDIASAIEHREGPHRIGETLNFLIDYTKFHFNSEEKYMAEHNYPGLAEHHTLHEELKKTLADLEYDFREEGPTHELADYINTFLVNWLVKHIQHVDYKFGEYLNEKGVKIEA